MQHICQKQPQGRTVIMTTDDNVLWGEYLLVYIVKVTQYLSLRETISHGI